MPTKAWKAQCNKIQQTHCDCLNVLKAAKAQREKTFWGLLTGEILIGYNHVQFTSIEIRLENEPLVSSNPGIPGIILLHNAFASLRDLRGLGLVTRRFIGLLIDDQCINFIQNQHAAFPASPRWRQGTVGMGPYVIVTCNFMVQICKDYSMLKTVSGVKCARMFW